MNKQLIQPFSVLACIAKTHSIKQTSTNKTIFMKRVLQLLLVAFLFLAGMPSLTYGQTTATFSTVGTTTWTCPAGVTSVQVECWGGGGAGGGVANVKYILAGGGAGGNYQVATVQVVPGTVYNIVVGAGGVGARRAAAAETTTRTVLSRDRRHL